MVSSQEGEEAPLNTSLALFLLSSLLQVSLGSGDHLQDNGLLWLHEAFRVQDQWDLEQEEKTTKQPRQLGERTDRTTGALQLTHIPATTCFQCISQLTGVPTAGASLLLLQSSYQLVFNSPQLLDKLVGEFWLSCGMVQRARCTDQQAARGGKSSQIPLRELQLNGGMQCHFV